MDFIGRENYDLENNIPFGINIENSENITIQDNHFNGYIYPIFIDYSASVNIANNVGSGRISIIKSDNSTLTGNSLLEGRYVVDTDTLNTLQYSENKIGMDDLIIFHNQTNIVQNIDFGQLIISSSSNISLNGTSTVILGSYTPVQILNSQSIDLKNHYFKINKSFVKTDLMTIKNSSNVEISKLYAENFDHGIVTLNSNEVLFEFVTIILNESPGTTTLFLSGTQNMVIQNSTFQNAGIGTQLKFSDSNIIRSNNFINFKTGFTLQDSDHNSIQYNYLSQEETDIFDFGSNNTYTSGTFQYPIYNPNSINADLNTDNEQEQVDSSEEAPLSFIYYWFGIGLLSLIFLNRRKMKT